MSICADCGHEHPLEELELTFRRPDVVAALQAEERDARVQAFERVYELWDEDSQADEPAFHAEIANDIRIHPPACGLSASLSLTGPTTRPYITLSPAEHPLVGEQRRGITAHRAAQYSSLFAPGAA